MSQSCNKRCVKTRVARGRNNPPLSQLSDHFEHVKSLNTIGKAMVFSHSHFLVGRPFTIVFCHIALKWRLKRVQIPDRLLLGVWAPFLSNVYPKSDQKLTKGPSGAFSGAPKDPPGAPRNPPGAPKRSRQLTAAPRQPQQQNDDVGTPLNDTILIPLSTGRRHVLLTCFTSGPGGSLAAANQKPSGLVAKTKVR